MLTANQEGYLLTVPDDRIARVVPYDRAVRIAADEIITKIKTALPLVKIFYLGSSKLGIAGENDIDITVIANWNTDNCLGSLSELFGPPLKEQPDKKLTKWEFTQAGFPVELYLMDKMNTIFQEQIDSQKILENSEKLKTDYEKIKLKYNNRQYKEYLKAKYEFWNEILGMK